MTVTAAREELIARMADDLRTVGVRSGGVLLVHSSLRALTPGRTLPGGPATVIHALIRALGPDGTLLLPGLSHMSVGPFSPYFDVSRTPCCVGAIPEFFRGWPEVLRSVNPTHSICALGPLAATLVGDHHLDNTPCGPHSPLSKLPRLQGQILMLGCGLRPNTSMHAIEETVNPPYLFLPHPVEYDCTCADGRRIRLLNRVHNFRGYQQRYDRLADVLPSPELRTGQVLGAAAHLIDSAAMWRRVSDILRHNPLHFVDRL